MTVPGGCRSQGCHGYLLRSLAAPFYVIRHLPHTHLLLQLESEHLPLICRKHDSKSLLYHNYYANINNNIKIKKRSKQKLAEYMNMY